MELPELLEWDSKLFARKIGKCVIQPNSEVEALRKILSNARKLNFDLVYVFTPINIDLDSLLTKAIYHVDTKMLFTKSVALGSKHEISPHISQIYTAQDLEPLYELAFESGKYSRFKVDFRLPESGFYELYRQWIDNSLNRKIADGIVVYKIDNQVMGLMTLQAERNAIKIGLLAVTPTLQGKGIGQELIKFALLYAYQNDTTHLKVATQSANKPACSFYEKYGFVIQEQSNIYHAWLSMPAEDVIDYSYKKYDSLQ